MSEEELSAIYAYLQTLPAVENQIMKFMKKQIKPILRNYLTTLTSLFTLTRSHLSNNFPHESPHKLQHKKDHHSGDGNIQPDRERPAGDFFVFLEFSGERQIKTG